jgi:hypothetical protein
VSPLSMRNPRVVAKIYRIAQNADCRRSYLGNCQELDYLPPGRIFAASAARSRSVEWNKSSMGFQRAGGQYWQGKCVPELKSKIFKDSLTDGSHDGRDV